MRVFSVLLFGLLVLMQAKLWAGKNGVNDYRQVQDEIAIQSSVNSELRKRNDEMFAEIDDLRQGLDAIEERARHELGMVKEGETFYRIIDSD
ncbi:cell division protein FtsB [Vibrio breoganii]|uniref:Cell division protein FtsB n=2 Tax=Vibrio TaxID=662 RepID=A0AAJ3S8T7_9VIBR|nr:MULTISPECIES: cell division protein FtsB [Vibrio]ANO33693.1 cell division protein FtsB [Vibrio breoganii]MDN3717191.1 cell division protein FtsB [Vibrio breoganii]NMO71849.1 cell division protein FtsB [Vibrio breoganii]NMR68387.1 cell division protein FtsB [Vibrio breoganii]OCH70755.1 cell division protein FtsB [Vibrio breoganii]